MNGQTAAAVLLAAAVLASPPPPRTRLPLRRRRTGSAVPPVAAALGIFLLSASPAVVMVCLIAAGALASRLRRSRRGRTRRREGEAIAVALDVVFGELKVGAHPIAAFAAAGSEAGGAVGRSLRAIATRAQFGADVSEGIRATAAQSAVPAYWERLVVFWKLAAEHGLAMSVLMRAAHRDIVERQRFADRMHAALSGARATAMILASLPALGVLLGQLVGADPIGFLLGGGSGGVLLTVGFALICIGIMWADRIVDRLAA